ncbi:MAG: glutathione S-transferase family protein [Robiginitomaculum sp.]
MFPGSAFGRHSPLVAQRAIGRAVTVMIEERTYWALVHNRWMEPKHAPIIRDAFFGEIPGFIRNFIFGKIVKGSQKDMIGHGIGKHPSAEIYAFAIDDIKAVEAILGDKPYLLGDRPSEYDASVYGLLANFMAKPFPSLMSGYIAESKPLTSYIVRVEKAAFG